MKLFIAQRTDEIGYDEYDSLVVAAKDEDVVTQLVRNEFWSEKIPFIITPIGTAIKGTATGFIHTSFNAG